jgi:hypothetical protein
MLEKSLEKLNKNLINIFSLCQESIDIFVKNISKEEEEDLKKYKNNFKKAKKLIESTSRLNLKVLALYSPNSMSLTEVYLYIRTNTILSLVVANIKDILSKLKNNTAFLEKDEDIENILLQTLDVLQKTSYEVLNLKNSKKINITDKNLKKLVYDNKKVRKIFLVSLWKKAKGNKNISRYFKVIASLELLEEVENKCEEISQIISKNTNRL